MRRHVLALAVFAFAFSAVAAEPDAEKRAALWQAFGAAWKDDVRVYAENDALTQICFRGSGKTYVFTLRDKTVQRVVHEKMVPFVNRISYEPAPRAAFVLWWNGDEQLRVGVDPN